MRLTLRFDMRAPAIGVPASVQYPTSVDMCEWSDRLGFETVYLAEHHGADDGYCPSPMIQASAILARTRSIRVHFSALLAPLHHPLRLAEDLATLDLLSGGRIEMTLGLGYRPHEYPMFGVKQSQRVRLLEEAVATLEQAWTGEPFEFRGEMVKVRPTPVQHPRPPIYIGGSTETSAYRAARLGDGYRPAGAPGLYEIFQEERRRLGLTVPPAPPRRGPLFLFVSDDPERDWPIVAPHIMYTSNSNHEWSKERGKGATPYPKVETLDDLKSSEMFAVVTPDECVDLAVGLGEGAELTFQPLMGGLDPEHGWRSLHLFESAVVPRLVAKGLRSAS